MTRSVPEIPSQFEIKYFYGFVIKRSLSIYLFKILGLQCNLLFRTMRILIIHYGTNILFWLKGEATLP